MVARVWHYTVGKRLRLILADGEIKPATAGVNGKERPAVWFSANEEWEETANKMTYDSFGVPVFLNKQQTHEHSGGLARIGVDPSTAPVRWHEFKERSGIPSKIAKAIY